MKLQFKIRNGDILDVKKAFVFRLNFDKEYLFYTTEDYAENTMVPVIFGELIGPSVIRIAPEERDMFEKFLYALANDQVDNISNYELINYKQLDVTILSAQKTKLPAKIIDKYSPPFEIVLPPKIDTIADKAPDIKPIVHDIKPNVIGNIDETKKESIDQNIKPKEPSHVSSNKNFNEKMIPSEIANKVFEQLVNADPVSEVMDTLEPLPLELNRQASEYNSLNDDSLVKSESSKSELNSPKEEIKQNKKTKKNKIFQIILMAILIAGIIYFGYHWIMKTYFKEDIDNLVETKTVTVFCETHPVAENNYRTTSRINAVFINDFLVEYVETKNLEFSNLDDYTTYKKEHEKDQVTNKAGYYEASDYVDENLLVYKQTQIIKDEMSLNDWVTYLGEDTTYDFLLEKYNKNGYVCNVEA